MVNQPCNNCGQYVLPTSDVERDLGINHKGFHSLELWHSCACSNRSELMIHEIPIRKEAIPKRVGTILDPETHQFVVVQANYWETQKVQAKLDTINDFLQQVNKQPQLYKLARVPA